MTQKINMILEGKYPEYAIVGENVSKDEIRELFEKNPETLEMVENFFRMSDDDKLDALTLKVADRYIVYLYKHLTQEVLDSIKKNNETMADIASELTERELPKWSFFGKTKGLPRDKVNTRTKDEMKEDFKHKFLQFHGLMMSHGVSIDYDEIKKILEKAKNEADKDDFLQRSVYNIFEELLDETDK